MNIISRRSRKLWIKEVLELQDSHKKATRLRIEAKRKSNAEVAVA